MNSKTTTAQPANTATSTSPIFILQKDIPTVKAGTEFVRRPMYGGEYYVPYPRTSVGNGDMFHPDFVENNKEWFVKKVEEKTSKCSFSQAALINGLSFSITMESTKPISEKSFGTCIDELSLRLFGFFEDWKNQEDKMVKKVKPFTYVTRDNEFPRYQKCQACGIEVLVPNDKTTPGDVYHRKAKSGAVYHRYIPIDAPGLSSAAALNFWVDTVEEIDAERVKDIPLEGGIVAIDESHGCITMVLRGGDNKKIISRVSELFSKKSATAQCP